jgi:hypothetical protein
LRENQRRTRERGRSTIHFFVVHPKTYTRPRDEKIFA